MDNGPIPGVTLDVDAEWTFDVEQYFTGDRLTYSYAQVDGEPGENPNAATVTYSGSVVTIEGDQAGLITWKVTASGPAGPPVSLTFTISVTPAST